MAYKYPPLTTFYSRTAHETQLPFRAFYEEAKARDPRCKDIFDAELRWLSSERAYYNIHPLAASALCKPKMEQGIMADQFVCPHGNDVFVIRLPEDHNIRELISATINDDLIVWQILVADWRRFGGDVHRNEVHFHIALGNRIKPECGNRIVMDCSSSILLKHAIDQHIESLSDKNDAIALRVRGHETEYRTVISNAVILAATLGFIDNPDCDWIQPDVLADLRNRYEQSIDPVERARIVAKSHKRKGEGYTVGTDLFFIGPQGLQGQKDYIPGSGKERQWQHIRRGHIHLHRYGPGRRFVKGMWQNPTLVRPDLPFKPDMAK